VTTPSAPPTPAFDVAARRVLAYLREALPLALWSVSRVENGRQTHLYLAEDNGYQLVPGDGCAWEDSFCIRMVERGAPSVAPDAQAVPVYAEAPANADLAVGAYAGVPVRDADGSLFGTICGIDPAVRTDDPAFLAAEPLLQLLSGLLSMVLAATRTGDAAARAAADARAAAERDALTGLVNRRGWDRLLAEEALRFERLADPTAVMVVDLDGLKRINDEQGHKAGDAYLRTAGTALRAAFRSGDVVARLGGDEFAVLLRGCTRDQGKRRVSRLYGELEAAGVAASIGCASGHPARGLAAAVTEADAAMYAAKRVRAAARTTRARQDEGAPLLPVQRTTPQVTPTAAR
jgi:diguanylate cyclase (GGDEF)-like protein